MTSHQHDFCVSVVIPVFNDQEVLPELFRRLLASLEKLCSTYEILFIDDGSTDDSMQVLKELKSRNDFVKVIQLTRNFGQPSAISAGIENAQGDVIVLMDSDLQDRPEDIGKLINAMIENDVPIAIARWVSRGDHFLKVLASQVFNRLTNRITNIQYAARSRVFRVIRREAIDDLNRLSEKTTTSISQLHWMGFDHIVVDLDRDPRYAGSSGYTLGRMLKLSLDRIFSNSLFPIRLSSFLGAVLGISSIL